MSVCHTRAAGTGASEVTDLDTSPRLLFTLCRRNLREASQLLPEGKSFGLHLVEIIVLTFKERYLAGICKHASSLCLLTERNYLKGDALSNADACYPPE